MVKKNVNPDEFVLKGILWKRGNVIRTWRQKIGVLTAEAIYFYDKEVCLILIFLPVLHGLNFPTSLQEQITRGEWTSFIKLSDVTLIHTVTEESAGRKWAFRVLASGETFFAAPSDEDMQQWIEKTKPHTKAGMFSLLLPFLLLFFFFVKFPSFSCHSRCT